VLVSNHDLQDEWAPLLESKSDRINCFGAKAALPSFKPPVGLAVTGTGHKWQCGSKVEDHACVQLVVPSSGEAGVGSYELRRVSTCHSNVRLTACTSRSYLAHALTIITSIC
jgi:hypothetical protein